jgi:xanthine/CO dehydrogenase XdhC/CoxF family maturation factor
MKDFQAIWKEYNRIGWGQRQGALATVVRVHGSSYRSPGARMLITDDGRWVGSISGGCLEGDALRKARLVMRDQTARLVTYDTREESNQQLGIGLGCNGVIDVLLQPLGQVVPVIGQVVAVNHPLALATVLNGPPAGDSVLISDEGKVLKNASAATVANDLLPDLQLLFNHRQSGVYEYPFAEGSSAVFMEYIQPVIHLILFGAGFDARPVSQLAASLGWRVEVTDECVAHIAPVFFPHAEKLSLCRREWVDRDFAVTPYTACVLMSHNYEYDRDVLKKLLKTPAPYIGLLGPRKRFDKMLAEFAQEQIAVTERDFTRIHSPIGLDIGAEAPDEIAVSIIAEIQAKFANRPAGFLKNIHGPIHQRQPASEQVLKPVYLQG